MSHLGAFIFGISSSFIQDGKMFLLIIHSFYGAVFLKPISDKDGSRHVLFHRGSTRIAAADFPIAPTCRSHFGILWKLLSAEELWRNSFILSCHLMYFKRSLGWALTKLERSFLIWVFPRTSWSQVAFLIATASILLVSKSEGFYSFFFLSLLLST